MSVVVTVGAVFIVHMPVMSMVVDDRGGRGDRGGRSCSGGLGAMPWPFLIGPADRAWRR